MKAWEIHSGFGIENLSLVERPDPAPGPHQVLVRMKAWSLNYRDLLVVTGKYNPRLKLPMVPLSDGAGEVAAVGPGVTRVQVGARVAGLFMQKWLAGELTDAIAKSALGGGNDGVLAEQVVFHEDGVTGIPDHLTFEEAATLPCAGLTAWHALVSEGRLKAGDTVLVQGTGGVSLFALQFARMHGARVLITSSSDDKLKRALELGAAAGTNYKSSPDWDKWALQQTDGNGVDHVVEVGGAGTLARSLKAVKPGGRVSLIGVLSGGSGDISLYPVLMKNVCVQGIFVGSREMFEAMNRAIGAQKMRPVVGRVFGFGEAREALRHLESGTHFGKISIQAQTGLS
jgi:NADPH:quinone reductase-like Zn-dependent oxidoreductase